MKLIKILCSFFFVLFSFTHLNAQTVPKKLTDKSTLDINEKRTYEQAKYFVELNDYSAALPMFEELVELHPEEPHLKYLLAQCYLKENTEEKEAAPLLEELKLKFPKSGELFFWLGKSYQYKYDFNKAIENYEFFVKNFGNDKNANDARLAITHCKNAIEVFKTPNSTNIVNLGDVVNTVYAEYAPVIVEEYKKLYYTFRGDSAAINNKTAGVSADNKNEFFEDVYAINLLDQNKWSLPKRMGAPFNADKKGHHDASVSISNNRNYMFIYKNKNGKESGDLFLLKRNETGWEYFKELTGINTDNWEGSACMTSDEKFIYFSSDRAGSVGEKDIFRASLQADGNYGAVVNIGKDINTPLSEDAPFISYDGKVFYFSSQGHNSIGGYDLFSCDIKEDGTFGPVKNLGYPINSISDDIYLTTTLDGKLGYMSSNRPGGFGQLDLYQFETGRMNKFTYLYTMAGKVEVKGKPKSCKIQVFDSRNELESTYHVSFRDGEYKITLIGGEVYHLFFTSPEFETHEEIVDLTNLKSNESKSISAIDLSIPQNKDSMLALSNKNLNAKTSENKTEETIAKTENKIDAKTESVNEVTVNLNKVFFDYDQTLVKAEFSESLNTLAKVMTENKTLKLVITGHADSKGAEEYNNKLSKQRAMAVANYLVVRGVSRNRMEIIAKGETTPLAPNENTDGTDNPSGRSKNRRVEFNIKNQETVKGIKINQVN